QGQRDAEAAQQRPAVDRGQRGDRRARAGAAQDRYRLADLRRRGVTPAQPTRAGVRTGPARSTPRPMVRQACQIRSGSCPARMTGGSSWYCTSAAVASRVISVTATVPLEVYRCTRAAVVTTRPQTRA